MGEAGLVKKPKALAIHAAAQLLNHPTLFRQLGVLARFAARHMPRRMLRALSGPWGKTRDVPDMPVESFSAWYRRNRGKGSVR